MIIAITSLPLAIALIVTKAATSGSTSYGVAVPIVGFAMILAQLSLFSAPWSLPISAVTGFAAVRGARVTIGSLNDAMIINFVASLIMALAGSFGAALLLGVAVAYSNSVWDLYASDALICAPAFAFVLFTLSFFGGLIYSVYLLKLKYVRQSQGP